MTPPRYLAFSYNDAPGPGAIDGWRLEPADTSSASIRGAPTDKEFTNGVWIAQHLSDLIDRSVDPNLAKAGVDPGQIARAHRGIAEAMRTTGRPSV